MQEVNMPFGKVDVELLKKQKETLLDLQAETPIATGRYEALEGIINLLNNVQGHCESRAQIIDLDYYCWRERSTDSQGQERLLIPHSDPRQYEYDIDQMFVTPEEAKEFLDEQYPGEKLTLVQYIGTIIEEYEAPD